MSKKTVILITGLTMSASKTLTPGMDTLSFGKAMEASIKSLSTIPNLEVHRFDLNHEADAESHQSVEAFRSTIRIRHYDVHLIGAGLKNIPRLTCLFETLVNELVASSDGKARLLFSTNGADHLEVIKRGCPELLEA